LNAKRFAGTEQLFLADEFVERAGRMRSASGWLAAGTSGSGAGGGNFEKRLTLF